MSDVPTALMKALAAANAERNGLDPAEAAKLLVEKLGSPRAALIYLRAERLDVFPWWERVAAVLRAMK